jgi:hypothetical protein
MKTNPKGALKHLYPDFEVKWWFAIFFNFVILLLGFQNEGGLYPLFCDVHLML